MVKIKISSDREVEVTEEVAERLSEIIRSLYMSVSDNYIVSNKNEFIKAYGKARILFLFGLT